MLKVAQVDEAQFQRLLAAEFDRRGWEYDLVAGRAILEAAKRAQELNEIALARAVPSGFLNREGIGREDVADAISLVIMQSEPLVRPATLEMRLLLIAASPLDEDRLRLEAELRDIKDRVRASSGRDSIAIEIALAARSTDLIDALNRFRPTVVHLAGHGGPSGLVLEDEAGLSRELSSDQVRDLVAVAPEPVSLVVLNACESSDHAESLLKSARAAIGMGRDVDDDSARTFAAQLYASLAEGVPLGTAFAQAKLQVGLAGLQDGDVPELFVRPGADAMQFVEAS
jgi:CHAT domain